MADFTNLKDEIKSKIKSNGKQEITGAVLQQTMLEMIDETERELETLSERIDNLPKDDEFDAEGNYPLLRVGTADTAIDLAGRGESVPASFGFRASGGKSIKDGRAYIKRIKGNSVVWNNQSENSLSQDSPAQSLPIGSKLVQEHKYLMLAESITNCALFLYYNIDGSNVRRRFENTYSFFTSDASISANGLVSGQGALWWYVLVQDSTVEYSANNVRLIDLTQMFQAGNEPTTIEEFNARKPIVEDEYAYNEGQVIHCNTKSIKSVGDNAWDEEWEVGGIGSNGQPNTTGNRFRSKNFIRVIPNQTYTTTVTLTIFYYDEGKNIIKYEDASGKRFTTPTNCSYIKFYCYGAEVYNNDVMIRLNHSGWKNEVLPQYQPYWQDILPLPIIRKYFPDGMKSAGTAHDEIRFNKATQKWEYSKGKIKSVDLGTLDWTLTSQQYFRAILPSDSIAPTNTDYNGFICAKYERVDFNLIYSQQVAFPCFGIPANNPVCCVSDSSYTDAATFKAAMQGVILYYESNEWEWVELDAEDQNFRDYYQVADFGTEQSQSDVPSANFSADIIYQFNAVDMIREHELEITELQKVIATMQAQLASLTNS